ncbi:MerR family transcriptional regulator [Sphingosinicellaceae bacterium]|nr:MerR family transcriptional regulator [Sphingosinicellaceae bacterium]
MSDDDRPIPTTATKPPSGKSLATKSSAAFRTIGEVAEELGVAQHVLRFWETRFPQVQPLKRGGNRRYYRPTDVELLRDIHRKLHAEGYTIKGVQKLLSERGGKGAPVSPALGELNLGGDEGLSISGEGPPPSFTDQSESVEVRHHGVDLAGVRAVRDRLASALAAARA